MSRKSVIKEFKGFNTSVHPTKLPDNILALTENYTLKKYGDLGTLATRDGILRYNSNQLASGGSGITSLFEATLNGTDYLIGNKQDGSSSRMRYVTSPYTGSWTTIGTGSELDAKLNYTSFRDKVYIANLTNGTTSNKVWDGTNYLDMGCPPPQVGGLTLTASAGGGLSAGAYRYLVTYLYDGNQESKAFAYRDTTTGFAFHPRVVAALNDKVTLTNIPTGNSRVTARKIYRTTAGAGSTDPYYYLVTIDDNTTTSYVDLAPDSVLTDSIDATIIASLPNFPYYSKYVALHKERLTLGSIKNDIFNALSSSEITIADSGTAGSLTGSTTYKYRFFKCWNINPVGGVILGEYLEKTHTTGIGITSVSITFSGTATWYGVIAIQRTSGGGSDFKFIGNNGRWGIDVTQLTSGYNDGLSDVTRDGGTGLQVDYGQGSENLPYTIVVSDAQKPDLFSTIETQPDGTLIPAGNTWDIGEPVTGIHSEENRVVIFGNNNIHELDTTSQSRQFWKINKVVSGIGSDDGLQCQAGQNYFFVKTTSVTKNKIIIYQWNGRGEPFAIDGAVRDYIADLNTAGTITVKDIKYYKVTNSIHVLTQYTDDAATTRTIDFIYNIDLENWEIITNATNLNLACMTETKNYGLIYGGGDGYIHSQQNGQNRDTIAGTPTNFKALWKTKKFTGEGKLYPRRLVVKSEANGSATMTVKTTYDGTTNSGNNINLVSGVNKNELTGFTDAQTKAHSQVSFQGETTANVEHKIYEIQIEMPDRHIRTGG